MSSRREFEDLLGKPKDNIPLESKRIKRMLQERRGASMALNRTKEYKDGRVEFLFNPITNSWETGCEENKPSEKIGFLKKLGNHFMIDDIEYMLMNDTNRKKYKENLEIKGKRFAKISPILFGLPLIACGINAWFKIRVLGGLESSPFLLQFQYLGGWMGGLGGAFIIWLNTKSYFGYDKYELNGILTKLSNKYEINTNQIFIKGGSNELYDKFQTIKNNRTFTKGLLQLEKIVLQLKMNNLLDYPEGQQILQKFFDKINEEYEEYLADEKEIQKNVDDLNRKKLGDVFNKVKNW